MFKFSQSNGGYEYNTASSMVIVEFIKLLMAASLHTKDVTDGGAIKMSFSELYQSTRREVQAHIDAHIIKTYAFLAVSYAVCNQMVFWIMSVADPGIFSLVKSSSPMLVAGMNLLVYKKKLSGEQWKCVVLLICGLIPVTSASCDASKVAYTFSSYLLMGSNTAWSALNSVVNANALKELKMTLPMQNMILYAMGVCINLIIYLFTSTGGGFFSGYGSLSVWFLIFLNASIGLAINAVYKYGDAVLKQFSQPICSSLLVFLSWMLFGMQLSAVKVAGTATVLCATVSYINAPRAGS
ncbi:hypothetical protein TrCOL_g8095 [Triparma columacea]|uniref:Uncharacterized protein n=1 Tax=Triparma columacea TaxID=722753 RepID=A0A9W7L9V9_9STRA|nr:hypothetical protein TrCOL_g8095 [Triparma columacea]